jgi:hypothetical protein
MGQRIILLLMAASAGVTVAMAQDQAIEPTNKTDGAFNHNPSTLSSGRLDFSLFRRNAEAAIKSGLFDPSSAQIEWPYGFTQGTWKPLLRKRISGYLTCGRVNAKNRMGGYVGATAFVVVLDASGNVIFKDIGDGGSYDLVAASCHKSASMFPPPQVELLDRAAPTPSNASLADQLAKLAELKASGALTQEEFDVAKKQLLGPGE